MAGAPDSPGEMFKSVKIGIHRGLIDFDVLKTTLGQEAEENGYDPRLLALAYTHLELAEMYLDRAKRRE